MKEWVLSVSVISIFAAILNLLLPKGENKKVFGFLIGVITVYTFVSPFVNLKDYAEEFDFDIDKSGYFSEFSDYEDEALRISVIEGVKTAISNALEIYDISVVKVNVVCKNNNGEFEVTEVEIAVALGEYDKEEVYKTVYDIVGSDCKITLNFEE